ncbi:C-type polyheme cytochrome OmcB [Geomonas sp. Red276]
MFLKCIVLLMSMTFLLSGCGSGPSTVQPTQSKLSVSQTCMQVACHGAMTSPGTGALIVNEWLASTHNTNNGAGCADCHEPDAGHPNLCNKCHAGGGFSVVINPDASGKCGKCHGLNHPGDIMVTLSPNHFGNMTASLAQNNYRASYVSSLYINNCNKCHNPHDPTSARQVNADWADSGHGNVTKARTNYDFKTRGTYQPVATTFQYFCERCHTTTGFIKFVTSGFTDQAPFAGPGAQVVQNAPVQVPAGQAQPADTPSPDKTKEVTGCDACHDDGHGRAYGYQVRNVPAAVIYYNFSSSNASPTVKLNNNPVTFPDLGDSNVCMPCHTGRGIGRMVKDAAAAGMDFSNTNAPSAHDRASGITLFQVGGYEFPGLDYTNLGFQHWQVGQANFKGTGTSGPCVTCHMKNSHSHLFLPVTFDTTGAVTALPANCASCHTGANSLDLTTYNTRKAGFQAAMAILNKLRTGKVVSLPNRNSNYNAAWPGGGANTMGVAFNYGWLSNDTGAFAHNPLYVKRIIYDSIDWIYYGSFGNDVAAAINSVPVAGTITAATKTNAINYLMPSGTRP